MFNFPPENLELPMVEEHVCWVALAQDGIDGSPTPSNDLKSASPSETTVAEA